MNEERATILNMALEGRLPMEDAARLLKALAALELGEEVADEQVVVEPPCRPPLWGEEAGDLLTLLQSNQAPSMISTATHEIVRFLRERNLSSLSWSLAALDLLYLVGFTPYGEKMGHSVGGQERFEEDGILRRRSINLITSWSGKREAELPMSYWLLFSGDLPVRPVAADEGLTVEFDGTKRRVTARPSAEMVTVPAGTFSDCLEVRYETLPPADDAPPPQMELCRLKHWSLWLAPGVGLVRLAGIHEDDAPVEAVLEAYGTPGGEGYFPLGPGGWWQFDLKTPSYHYREVWRAFFPLEAGKVWLSTATRNFTVGEGA